MRMALSGSALVHGAVVAALFIGFVWPKPDDAPAGVPVTVDIISLSAVSANTTETIESDASQTMVSAGVEASNVTTSEVLAPLDSTAVEPVAEPLEATTPPSIVPKQPEPITAVAPPPVDEPATTDAYQVAELSSLMPDALESLIASPLVNQVAATPPIQPETVQATAIAPLEPISAEDLKVAPTPQTLTLARTSTPTYPDRSAQPKPPTATPPPLPQQAAPAGNGGSSDTEAAASSSAGQQGNEGAGGDAAIAQYPGQVLSKLRRALRYPSDADGASGEAHVQFVIAASGSASGIQVVRSSGNAAIDQAAMATVARAAPFPVIPPAANRNAWTFTVPLAFQR